METDREDRVNNDYELVFEVRSGDVRICSKRRGKETKDTSKKKRDCEREATVMSAKDSVKERGRQVHK